MDIGARFCSSGVTFETFVRLGTARKFAKLTVHRVRARARGKPVPRPNVRECSQ